MGPPWAIAKSVKRAELTGFRKPELRAWSTAIPRLPGSAPPGPLQVNRKLQNIPLRSRVRDFVKCGLGFQLFVDVFGFRLKDPGPYRFDAKTGGHSTRL